MYIKKLFVTFGIILLLAGGIASADNSVISFTFAGAKVDPEIRVVVKDGAKFVNLPFLAKYLHVVSDWNPTDGDLDLRFGKYSTRMFENSTKYKVNGSSRKLRRAPFQRDGQLWLPVEYLLRLGLVIKNESRTKLSLDWEHNYLLGIENVKYQERPAFLLVGAKSFTVKSFLLSEPARLVVDVIGVKAHFALGCSTGQNPMVKNVRFSQINPKTVRLVFDLNQLVGYQIVDHPEQENQVLIVFNYAVEEVRFFQKDEEQKVYIQSSFPAVYDVKSFVEPNRLIIDFDGATLVGTSTPIMGDGKWVSKVRMSQYTPQTVRVVLDLISTAPSFVIRARGNPNLIEVRTIQTINRVNWFETDQGERLIIEGNGELVEEVKKLQNPEQLQIGLDFAQFDPGLRAPYFKSNQVKGVHLVRDSTTESRLDIDLAYFVGYRTQLSEDRRKLTVNFKHSPFIGKTIILDPGHGGVDSGAWGRQGTREKEVNLDVTMRLKNLLESAGAAVILTRFDDNFIGLYERCVIANNIFGDLFISIHTNNHPDLSVEGIELFHLRGRTEAQILARNVFEKIVQATGLKGLGVKINDFVVIRETQMPSILIELGFLSNFQEESTIKTTQFRDNAALGIFQGIMEYYQN